MDSDQNSQDTQNLVTIESVLSGVPEPVQTSFFAAASRLLGGLIAYPAAWLRRPTQSIEDVTDARSLVAKGLAEETLRLAKNNPLIMQAALEAYVPDTVRKVVNRAKVTAVAAEEIRDQKGDGSKAAPPDDDWMNSFMRFAEDASSERLQRLFGKILAGEITNPGSFSPSTLRVLSEMTTTVAGDFEWFWGMSIGQAAYYSKELNEAPNWARLSSLRDAGLVQPQPSTLAPPSKPTNPDSTTTWTFGAKDHGSGIAMVVRPAYRASIQIAMYTRTGLELGSLLPRPNFEGNLRAMVEAVSKNNVVAIMLVRDGVLADILWQEPSSEAA